MNKKLFIFSYGNMNLGGIQKTIYHYIKTLTENNVDILWLSPKNPYIDKGYIEAFKNVYITNGKMNLNIIKYIQSHASVVAIAFELLGFERLKHKLSCCKNVKYIYIIPHFENPELYPDQYFKLSFHKKKYYSIIRRMYMTYLDNNELFFLNTKQYESLFKYYSISCDNPNDRLTKKTRQPIMMKKEDFEKRVAKDEFNIISVCRFEFPHKGYLLGLIDRFGEIKNVCPNAVLSIIGYGRGLEEVYSHIHLLPKHIQDSIRLIGKVSYTQLESYYSVSQLSIGLAGSANDSSSLGVPTLIARHYCNSCEVYGLFTECPEQTISDKKGKDPVEYIKMVYLMDSRDYVELCYNTYNVAYKKSVSEYDPLWLFKVKPGYSEPVKKRYIKRIDNQAKIWLLKYRLSILFSNPKTFIRKLRERINNGRNQ